MWGWATWKDSWKKYDKNMKKWDYEISKQAIKNVLCNRRQYEYVKKVYEKTFNKEIDTWDYQWGFTRQVNNGLSVVPSVNLVKNVGVGSRATNTYTSNTLMPKNSFEIKTPLRHPFFVAPDRDYDGRVHNLRSQSSLYNFLQKAISIISS
jgi:hypothetical protein